MFTDEIIERRNAVLKDWPAFVKQPSSHLIAEFIERDQTDLPSNYCPWAPGIVIASDYLVARRKLSSWITRPVWLGARTA